MDDLGSCAREHALDRSRAIVEYRVGDRDDLQGHTRGDRLFDEMRAVEQEIAAILDEQQEAEDEQALAELLPHLL